jgi:hypothetical protein
MARTAVRLFPGRLMAGRHGDQRPFVYELASHLGLLRRRLEEALANLTSISSDVEMKRKAWKEADFRLADTCEQIASAATGNCGDTQCAQRLVESLAGLQRARGSAAAAVVASEARMKQCRDAVAAYRAEIDKLESDRAQRLAHYLREHPHAGHRDVDQEEPVRQAWIPMSPKEA